MNSLLRLDERPWLVPGLLITVIAVILDQATKRIADVQLRPMRTPVDRLPGPLYFELTLNDGAAFGLPAPSWLFMVVTIIVLVMVLRTLPRLTEGTLAIAYSLLLGGALGNAVDRIFSPSDLSPQALFDGHVVDFIASDFFPTFNVADIFITAGFILLVIGMWIAEREAEREAALLAATAEDVERPTSAPGSSPVATASATGDARSDA